MSEQIVSGGRKINLAKVWCAKDDTFRTVAIDPQFNSGKGIGAYLEKRDEISGKPLFYTEAQRLSMTDNEVKIARDFSEPPKGVAKRADDIIGQLLTADPATLRKAREILLGGGDEPKPAPVAAPVAKAGK